MNRIQLRTLATEIRLESYAATLAGKDYAGIAGALNERETIANPVEQPSVPMRFTWDTFLQLLSGTEVWGLYGQGNFPADLRRALEANNITERNELWEALKTALPAATATKVETEFAKSQPDPDWQSTVTKPSRAMELSLPVVTESDVLRAAQIEI